MKIAVMGSKDMITGYKLAGIKNAFEIESKKEAEQKINEIKDKFGLIIILDKYTPELEFEELDTLIMSVPGMEGPSGEEEKLEDVVKSAVGVEVE